MQNLVIKFPLQRIEHTYLLTSSPSEFNILFVLEEFPSHALDCGVPPSCARTNEVGEVFLGDLEQVIRIAVPVVNDVAPNEFCSSVSCCLLQAPEGRLALGIISCETRGVRWRNLCEREPRHAHVCDSTRCNVSHVFIPAWSLSITIFYSRRSISIVILNVKNCT